jgi:hypothetical protein
MRECAQTHALIPTQVQLTRGEGREGKVHDGNWKWNGKGQGIGTEEEEEEEIPFSQQGRLARPKPKDGWDL